VTGIFVQDAIESARCDHEESIHTHLDDRRKTVLQFAKLFAYIDKDSDGLISIGDLSVAMKERRTRADFAVTGLEVDEAFTLFAFMDVDGDGLISLEEFLVNVMPMIGQARSSDLVILRARFESMCDMYGEFKKAADSFREYMPMFEQIVQRLEMSPVKVQPTDPTSHCSMSADLLDVTLHTASL